MRNRLIAIAAALALFYGAYQFVAFARAASELTRANGDAAGPRADAIVVLTGGKGRISEGLRLLRQNRSPVLILSGVDADADVDSIFLGGLSSAERSSIILEKRSRSTYENATQTRRLMDEKGLRSIILITSAYHMKRAQYLFLRVLPEGASVVPHPVQSPNYDVNRWWRSKSLGMLIAEFAKYHWYVLRFSMHSSAQ